MHPGAFPNHPPRRPRRRRDLPRRMQAVLAAVLGPRGHRRPVLYHIAIALLVLIAALAMAGRPTAPGPSIQHKGDFQTIATSHRR